MAMGRAVIGTPAGFNGIDIVSGADAVVAATADEFAGAIEHLSADASSRQEIETNARITAVERFDWESIGKLQTALWTAHKDAGTLR